MTAERVRRSTASSRNRFAPHAARRWIAIPILLALLGAGAGVAVGYTAKPSAEALLLVQTDATDAVESERAVESTAIELNTSGFFSAVVRGTGKDPRDLQARTRIAVKAELPHLVHCRNGAFHRSGRGRDQSDCQRSPRCHG